ncbi:MAG: phosphatidate cytidylyltransferase [Bacteroidia bacterium]|nr:phosphatidate cytidylyltransferase [Bacteroidia bacterium]
MNPAILNTFYLAGGFLALFGSAELMYHRYKVRCEVSRKYVHFATGVITLLFPVLLSSHWLVLLLCGSFLMILTLSLKLNMLQSINAIDRVSRGSILYPIVVYLAFLVQSHYEAYIFFYIPILILAISDPLAALFGKKYPIGKYVIIKDQKTLLGSSVFFLSAFLISLFLLMLMVGLSGPNLLLLSLVLAFGCTLSEAISQNGYDNLSIPIVGMVLLAFAEHIDLLSI